MVDQPIETMLSSEQRQQIETLATQIRARPPLIVFTGAGISTDSGIPDYRGPNGLWTTGHATPVTYQDFMSSVERQLEWWRALPGRVQNNNGHRFNSAHAALADLERRGWLSLIVTQNIDGFHTDAGNQHTIELHGNTRTIRCTQCGSVFPISDFLTEIPNLTEPPQCPVCGGVLKSGTIAFGQPLPQEELRHALVAAAEAGVMLVVGSTLTVNPAAQVPLMTHRAGGYLAIINLGETAMDQQADLRIEASVGPALAYLAELLSDQA